MPSSAEPGRTTRQPAAGDLLLDLQFEEKDLYAVRRTVGAHADTTSLSADRIGDLVLMVSELVSNTIRHGGGTGRLRLWTASGEIICEVTDNGPGIPQRPSRERPQPNASGGRGLWLVLTYADTMTVENPVAGGSRVTVSLRLDGPDR